MWSTQIPVTFKLLASAACISLLSGCAILGYECPDDDITCNRDTDIGFGPNSEDYDRADLYRAGEPGDSDSDSTGPGDVAGTDSGTGDIGGTDSATGADPDTGGDTTGTDSGTGADPDTGGDTTGGDDTTGGSGGTTGGG